MSVNFTPDLGNYENQSPFRHFCQSVLPTVYDDSLSYGELLNRVVNYLNVMLKNNTTMHGDITNLLTAYEKLQQFTNDYFDNLDVQNEINNKLDDLANDGTLSELISPFVMANANPIIVNSVSDMTNHEKIYLLKSTGTLYYYDNETSQFKSSALTYGIDDDVKYSKIRGSFTNLGYTNFSDCTATGIFSVTSEQAKNANDNPPSNQSGGLVVCSLINSQLYQQFIPTRGSRIFTRFKSTTGAFNSWVNGCSFDMPLLSTIATGNKLSNVLGDGIYNFRDLDKKQQGFIDKPTTDLIHGFLYVSTDTTGNIHQYVVSSDGRIFGRQKYVNETEFSEWRTNYYDEQIAQVEHHAMQNTQLINQNLININEFERTEQHSPDVNGIVNTFVGIANEFKVGSAYIINYECSIPIKKIIATIDRSISSSHTTDIVANKPPQLGTIIFEPTNPGGKYLTFVADDVTATDITATGKITFSLPEKINLINQTVIDVKQTLNDNFYNETQFSGSHGNNFIIFPFEFVVGKTYKIAFNSDVEINFIYSQKQNNINTSQRAEIIANPHLTSGEITFTPSVAGGNYLAFRCASPVNPNDPPITITLDCTVTFSLNDNIQNLQTEIIQMKQNGNSPIPAYYYENNYIDNKIQTIKNNLGFRHGVAFIFITDLHFLRNQKNSSKLIKKIMDETNVPAVICGGDLVYLYGTNAELLQQVSDFNNFKSEIGKNKIFSTRGNHELYNITSVNNNERHQLNSNVYDELIRINENQVTNLSINNMCYCIDNTVQKTRIVMLNTSDFSNNDGVNDGGILIRASTLNWLADVLTEKNDYNIIIVSHHHIIKFDNVNYDIENEQLLGLVTAFKNKTPFTITNSDNSTRTVNFSDTTNKLICCVSGHRHMDLMDTKNNILNIGTTCDCLDVKDGYRRLANTITEQAFDVYCVNYDTNKINIVRVGAGNDRLNINIV